MKKNILFAFFLGVIANFANAQPFTSVHTIDPNAGIDPLEIASGDLDGDGDIDIVMATYNYNGGTPAVDYIKWYKNDGHGNFSIELVSSDVLWIDGLTVADIDGQYGLDIVATSSYQNKLVYFLSDGVGFGPEVVVDGALGGPGEVVAGDINNDGTIDLAVVSYDENKTTWYSNDGSGNFTMEADIENGSTNGPYYLDLGDFDGDGDLDVVVGFYNTQTIEIYYNQYVESGTNTVSWIKDTTPVSTGNSAILAVRFADVNNDGIMDVIKADNITGDVAWYEKTVNGPSVEHIVSDESIIDRPGMVYVVDLDGDTYNDVIVVDGGAADDAIIYFKGEANAAPSATPTLVTNNNHQYWDITVGDFDGDSDMDIAVPGRFNDAIEWSENLQVVLGISDTNLPELSIYPNPTSGILHFKGITDGTLISIYDTIGKNILNTTLAIDTPLDVSALENGVYLIKFDGKDKTFKFIKR